MLWLHLCFTVKVVMRFSKKSYHRLSFPSNLLILTSYFLKWCFNKNKRFLRGGRIILTFSSAFSNAPYPVSFPEKGVDYSVSGAQHFQLSKSKPAGGQIESMLPSVIATDTFKTLIFQMARFAISDNQYLRWLFTSWTISHLLEYVCELKRLANLSVWGNLPLSAINCMTLREKGIISFLLNTGISTVERLSS